MALPELDVARVQRWCAARVPEHARHPVRVECEVAPRHLTIVERRAPWREDFGPEWTAFPIARLRYTAADKSWTLYWRDRNLRFHLYEPMAPSHRVEDPRHQTAHLPPLRWGQLQPSRRGQFRLTSPDSCPASGSPNMLSYSNFYLERPFSGSRSWVPATRPRVPVSRPLSTLAP